MDEEEKGGVGEEKEEGMMFGVGIGGDVRK